MVAVSYMPVNSCQLNAHARMGLLSPTMRTVQEIRLSNFKLLLAEAGGQTELKQRTTVPGPYISQLDRGVLQKGKPRSIGDVTARKLERGMGKPLGWMDRDHSLALLFSELNGLEGQLVTVYRQLDEGGKNKLLEYASTLARESSKVTS